MSKNRKIRLFPLHLYNLNYLRTEKQLLPTIELILTDVELSISPNSSKKFSGHFNLSNFPFIHLVGPHDPTNQKDKLTASSRQLETDINFSHQGSVSFMVVQVAKKSPSSRKGRMQRLPGPDGPPEVKQSPLGPSGKLICG